MNQSVIKLILGCFGIERVEKIQWK